ACVRQQFHQQADPLLCPARCSRRKRLRPSSALTGRGTCLKAEPKDEPDVPAFVALQFEPLVSARIAVENGSEDLRHYGQCCPTFLVLLSSHWPKIQGGVFPNSIFRQFIVIARLDA